MKQNFAFVFFVCAVLGISSCTNNAEVEVPTEEKKLAISCFISPSEPIIRCLVGHSLPIYGTNEYDFPIVSNADVVISNGEISTTLVYDEASQFYQIDQTQMPIVAGRTYTLRVTSHEYGVATSQTTLPTTAAIPQDASTRLEVQESAFGYNYRYINKVTWLDPQADLFNYYQVSARMFGVSFGNPTEREMGLELINDGQLEDGKLVSRSEMLSSDSISQAIVVYKLMTCNKDYYEFHRTAYSQGNNSPFTEPVIMYDNVENGFGCFGGYLQELTTVDVTE
jgi:hypothetical protein